MDTSERSRPDVTGDALRDCAEELGWAIKRGQESGTSIAVTKTGHVRAIVTDLSRLVAIGAASDWWIGQVSIARGSKESPAVSIAFVAGHRIRASRAAARATARLHLSGRTIGRPPSISPELLQRIVTEKQAGKSYRRIASDLGVDGVPPPSGGRRWYASTVRAAHIRGIGR